VYEKLKSIKSSRHRCPAPIREKSATGSNNCVVTGSKSATGMPILLGDPQMHTRIPAVFHEVVLRGGDFKCRGTCFPGFPGLIVGFAEDFAWAVTGLGGERTDIYEEKLNPDNPEEYLYKESWEPVTKRTETIKVKDGDDITFEVRSTHHGPICGELFGFDDKTIALKTVAFQVDDTISLSFLRVNLAKDYDTFREAVRNFEGYTGNMIYGDKEGRIAYWPAGKYPIRKSGMFWGPVPGWTGEYEWSGYVPFEELPTLDNPDQDFIATANNQIVCEWYPYQIVQRPGAGTRFLRLCENILDHDKIDMDIMQNEIRADITCTPDIRAVAPLLKGIVAAREGASPEVIEAAERLAGWDGRFTPDTIAGTIFDKFVDGLGEAVCKPHLGDDYKMGIGSLIIVDLASDSRWFNDPATPEVETRDDVFYKLLCKTIETLTAELGSNQDEWLWGKVSRIPVQDFMKELGIDDKLKAPDLGLSYMGGRYALCPQVMKVMSYSQIVDVTDPDKTRAVLAVGVSELFDSPHCHDQFDMWREFGLRPAHISEDKLIAVSESEVVLKKG
ncbi:penicillin acylase family protein, partial [Candidatus Hydrogenedentota bacterium]